MNAVQVLVLAGLSCLVAACGGGGGGGGGSDAGGGGPSGPKQQIVYAGATQQMTLTQENAMRMASNAYSLLDLVVTLSDIDEEDGSDGRPWFLVLAQESIPDPIDDAGQECDSGSMKVETESISASKDKVLLNFENCVMDGVLFHGSIRYTLDYLADVAPSADLLATLFIEYLLIQDDQEKIELSGDLVYSERQGHRYTGNITAKLAQQDRVIKLDHLNMAGWPNQLSTRFYDSRSGYVDVELTADSTILRLKTSEAELTIAPQVQGSPGLRTPIQEFSLSLSGAMVGSFTLYADLEPDDFFEWAYRDNLPPTLIASTMLEVTRLDDLLVNAGQYFQDNLDFLAYSVSLTSTNPGCTVFQQQSDFENFNVQFHCYGDQVLSVKVNDGIHERTQTVPVHVLPRAAEFNEISDQVLGEGDTLNVPVSFRNQQEDGPFILSLTGAPAGISVGAGGYIQGEPEAWLKEKSAHFTVGLRADNGKTATSDFQVELNVAASAPEFMPAETNNRCLQPWIRLNRYDSPVRNCISQESVFLETIQDNQLITAWALPYALASGMLRLRPWVDVDGDDKEEVLMGIGNRFIVVNPATNEVVKTINLPFSLANVSSFPGLDPGGKLNHQAILIYLGSTNSYYLVNVETGLVQALSLPAAVKTFGNTNADPEPELILANGDVRSLSNVLVNQVAPAGPVETFVLKDVDGDGQNELVRYVADYLGKLTPATLVVTDFRDPGVAQQVVLTNPAGGSWSPSVGWADLDSGVQGPELFARAQGEQILHVFAWQDGGYVFSRSVTLPAEYVSSAGAPVQELEPGVLFLAVEQGEDFLFNFDANNFETIEDFRSTLLVGGTSKLFNLPSGEFLLFLANGSRVQQVRLDATGRPLSTSSVSTAVDIDATSIQYFDVTGDGTREYVAAYSDGSRYRILNVVTGAVLRTVTLANTLNGPMRLVDVDGAGGLELLAPTVADNRCLGIYQVGQGVPYQTLHCGATIYALKTMSQLKVHDVDGNGKPELIDLERTAMGFVLRVYEHSTSGLVRLQESVQNGSAATSVVSVALQDVDGNGQLDILAPYTNPGSNGVYRFSKQASASSIVSVPAGMVPDLLVTKSNPSLLMVADASSSVTLQEINPFTGSPFWTSKAYVGSVNASSLHVLGNDVYQSGKVLVTDDGLLRFAP